MSSTSVILPQLGLTMEEGKVVAWRKKEGDTVAAGEILFEVETDKATMEVESPTAGIVRKVLVQEGETVAVATVVAVITDTADEPVGGIDTASARTASPSSAPTTSATTAVSSVVSSASAPLTDGGHVRSSPAARKRAQELGVDVAGVRGTGPGGRVTLEDVEGATRARAAPDAMGAGERRVPLTRMRRAIAEAMTRAAQTPQFQVSRDVDMRAADELRKRESVSYMDVLVAASARALAQHERFRGRFEGDAIVISERVHIGIAVALQDGLIVPVIRDADQKDLRHLALERERLEQGARAGKLAAHELTGAVFTISNLGTLGIDRFQALVNPPEAAILAVGRVSEEKSLALTLSVDHRVADGADAARFLADIAAALMG